MRIKRTQTKSFFRWSKGSFSIKTRHLKWGILLLILFIYACNFANNKDKTEETTETETETSAPTCAAPSEWFPQSQTPPPNPNVDFNSFCAFHQWAWQSYLWLTQVDETTGMLRFEKFPTSQDVIDGKQTLADASKPLKLRPRTKKRDGSNQPLDEINQAGEGGILVDHNGKATYYSQYVNPTMFNDIVSQKWNDPKVLNSMPPTVTFKTGDVELKASWKIVGEGDDTSKFVIRPAVIDKLVNKNGQITVDTDTQIDVHVALVGLHIVGTVKGHPEGIWATFEHNKNAPDFAANQNMNEAVSDQDWTYYTANTKAIDCNQLNTPVLALNEANQTISPISEVARVFPFGTKAGAKADPNLKAIQELNASVLSQLAADNVTKNYFEVGAVWTTGLIAPNLTLQDSLVGSKFLSNSVIETFTQNITNQNNCFGCHNTMQFQPDDPKIKPLQGTNINWSHIILEAYLENQNKKSE